MPSHVHRVLGFVVVVVVVVGDLLCEVDEFGWIEVDDTGFDMVKGVEER
jgi:hypothetical protein